MLEVLLASLIKNQYNLRLLHWNVSGCDFDTTHTIMDGYIDKFSDYIDLIAELILRNNNHVPDSREIDTIARENNVGKPIKSQPYSTEKTFNIVQIIFNEIITIINKCYENNYENYVNSELDNLQSWFTLEGKYKSRNRLTKME
jgi:DNA-binding ferritin-like protein